MGDADARLRAAAGKPPRRASSGEPRTSFARVESDRGRKNSRAKGSRGELDVAKVFARWSGAVVRRTPQSGGWSSAKFGVTADLVCDDPAFALHVEVKFREGWVLDDLVTGARRDHDKSVLQWWIQCVRSCPVNDLGFTKSPILVFRRARQPWLVLVQRTMFATNVRAMSFATLSTTLRGVPPVAHENVVDVVVMTLDDFVENVQAPVGMLRGVR